MSKYDEMLEKAAEKHGHCRVAGGLDDHDIARQMLESIGITRESVEHNSPVADGDPNASPWDNRDGLGKLLPATPAEPAPIEPAQDIPPHE